MLRNACCRFGMLSYTMSYLSQHQKDIVGALGGIFMAICLIPQLAHMYTSKSARDLSYAWTAWYIIGLSFTGATCLLTAVSLMTFFFCCLCFVIASAAACYLGIGMQSVLVHVAASKHVEQHLQGKVTAAMVRAGAYLFLEGATVGWISTVVEVSLAWVVVFGKAYLDA